MRNFCKGILGVLMITVFTLNFCGCVLLLGAAAGTAGTAMWLSGKLTEVVDTPYGTTVKATKKALESLNMPLKKEAQTERKTEFTSEWTDGTAVWIIVTQQTLKSSKIEIRVGMRGDKEASTKILDRIQKYL